MAEYVFTARDTKGECVLYAESTVEEDKVDEAEGVSGGSGYMSFWKRCWADVIAYGKELHGEFDDLDTGETVKSF